MGRPRSDDGPTASQLRARAAAGIAAAAASGHTAAPQPPAATTAPQAVYEAVVYDVQVRWPGRRCQLCPSAAQQLATVATAGTGGGYDYYCARHAPIYQG